MVDERALAPVLSNRSIAGRAIDVLARQPPPLGVRATTRTTWCCRRVSGFLAGHEDRCCILFAGTWAATRTVRHS